MPIIKIKMQNPAMDGLTRLDNGFLRITNEIKINKIPNNKNPQIKNWGILTIDSKNIPAMNERQRKNNVLDGVVMVIIIL